MFRGVEHEAAETTAHVDDALAGLQAHFARDVFHLGDLRVEHRCRGVLVVRAGVHQIRRIEHFGVELGAEAVVEAGVLLRRRAGAVVETQAVPTVADAHQEAGGVVEAGVEAHRHEFAQVAFDVDVAVEIRFQEADVTVERGAQRGAGVLDVGGDGGFAAAANHLRAIRQNRAKRQRRGGAHGLHHPSRQRAGDAGERARHAVGQVIWGMAAGRVSATAAAPRAPAGLLAAAAPAGGQRRRGCSRTTPVAGPGGSRRLPPRHCGRRRRRC